ncbi:MAG: DUF1249 domain-containing protein [Gammaproteobacteria bacterium]|nr:DUF1249 domain-containing protein [Gammaproteobacteria bacterium]
MVTDCWVRPGTLGGLISLYESNFIKLAALLGELDRAPGQFVSHSRQDLSLHLSVEDGSRYTKLLRLTYLFDDADGAIAEPDLVVRLYLDARVAEVAAWAETRRHATLAALAGLYDRELDRRWACNMVLSKWLDYLLENGHTYAVTAAR